MYINEKKEYDRKIIERDGGIEKNSGDN